MKGLQLLKNVVGAICNGPSYFIYSGHFDSHARKTICEPAAYNLCPEETYIQAADGTLLHTWLFLAGQNFDPSQFLEDTTVMHEIASAHPTIILFHSNGGNIGDWLGHVKKLHMANNCNVFLLEYRGFGRSQGRPNEAGIKLDAQAALDYLDRHYILAPTRKILYGISLGGAVALHLAVRNPDRIHGIILENTFLSIPSLIEFSAPYASRFASLLIRSNRWDSASLMKDMPGHIPILLLSGLEDRIVPPEHMRLLRILFLKITHHGDIRLCQSSEFAHGEHNNTCIQPGYWNKISSYLTEHFASSWAMLS